MTADDALAALLRAATSEITTQREIIRRQRERIEELERECKRMKDNKRREVIYKTHEGGYSGFVEGDCCHFLPRFSSYAEALQAASEVPDSAIY